MLLNLELEEVKALKQAESSIFAESDLKAAAPVAESPGVYTFAPASTKDFTDARSGAGDLQLRKEDLYQQYEESSGFRHPELVVDAVRSEDLFHQYEELHESFKELSEEKGMLREERYVKTDQIWPAEVAEHSGIENIDQELHHESDEYRQMRNKLLQQIRADAGEGYTTTLLNDTGLNSFLIQNVLILANCPLVTVNNPRE